MTAPEILDKLVVLLPKAVQYAQKTRWKTPFLRLKLAERILMNDGDLKLAVNQIKQADQAMLTEEIRGMATSDNYREVMMLTAGGHVEEALILVAS